MKMNCWLVFAVMVSGSLLAQTATNLTSAPADPPPAVPAAAEPAAPTAPAKKAPAKAPAKKSTAKAPAKKAAPKKSAPELKTVPLVPGPASVAASNVNVRAQAKLASEVVARLSKGQEVRVVEEIILKNSGPDEPSAWAKIELPPGTHGWVNRQFIDAATKAVKSRRLNVRSGPGENFSVLARVEKDAVIKEVSTKGDWIQIEAPAGAFAFVAAQYLQQAAPAPEIVAVAAASEPKTNNVPPTEIAAVTEPPVVAPAPVDAPPIAAASSTNVPPATSPGTNEVAGTVEMTAPEPEEVLPPRIISREGIVRGTGSIQAPTRFGLVSPDTKRLINYLYSTAPNLDLQRYKGIRIIVTGEESMDERWGNTPVITIQRIQVVPE
jgi:uncharacterized protein YgiM (DUF1202 family)